MNERITEPLTPRQTEVMQWVERGATNKEIAERLGISERTVESHVSEGLSKLGFENRVEFLVWVRGSLRVDYELGVRIPYPYG